MNPLLQVALFTIVGGVIGYVTNVVAVRMLFRPRNPVCILPGGRLCIQGLIPARKDQLAKRLGVVAASYAFSSGAIERYRARLERELEKVVLRELEKKLNTLPPIARQLVPREALEAVAAAAAKAVAALMEKAADNIDVASMVEEEFTRLPEEEIEKAFRHVAGRELRFIEVAGLILGAVIGLAEGVIAALIT